MYTFSIWSQVSWNLLEVLLILTLYCSSHQLPVLCLPSSKPLVGTVESHGLHLHKVTWNRHPWDKYSNPNLQVRQGCHLSPIPHVYPAVRTLYFYWQACPKATVGGHLPFPAETPCPPGIQNPSPALLLAVACVFMSRLVRQGRFNSPAHPQHQQTTYLRINERTIRILSASYPRLHQYPGKIQPHLSP